MEILMEKAYIKESTWKGPSKGQMFGKAEDTFDEDRIPNDPKL